MNQSSPQNVTVSEQTAVRMQKRQELLDSGVNPYPVNVGEIESIARIRRTYVDMEPNTKTDVTVTVAGRLISIRNAGKLSFAVIQSGRGETIQLMLSRAEIGEESQALWKRIADLGDHVSATGLVSTSMTGELSIFVSSWNIISKALNPLPNLHDGLNEETRARQRYLDLIVNPEARNMMLMRSKMISAIRHVFNERDFIEVETPMLQTIHGGAAARPFITHSNAMDTDLYLRIAPELFLKRAIVGGADRVFEINKNFRNEGMDSTHSPEFTMLEAYEVYADYNVMADLVEELVKETALQAYRYLESSEGSALLGSLQVNDRWNRISLYGSLSEKIGQEITPATSVETLQGLAEANGVEVAVPTHGKLVEELWEHFVKPTLNAPTFVMDFPVDTSPLVAAHRSIEGVVEKWDLYINGMEVSTGYSELVDPVVQRERLVEQALLSGRGDVEAMALDEAFLTALEYGMPPTGGIGIGIDRLMMVFTGKGIRDTVLFPLVK